MAQTLWETIKGVIAFAGLALNTLLCGLLIYLFIPFKLLLPFSGIRRAITRIMVAIGENWISINITGLATLHNIEWKVTGLEGLRTDRSYLVFANHRSWVDIPVLQNVFNRKIPFLRFFLKHQLIYVPVLGGAWWALDYPFMKRHSRATLEKHPEKRAEDYESVRRAGERFKGMPVSVLNFLEGTRFTQAKHDSQGSPFPHLLLPKAGGVAFVLETMGSQFEGVLDVTIYYTRETVSLWDLLAGKVRQIYVDVRKISIPIEIQNGRYLDDPASRERMQTWVKEIWSEKEQKIAAWKKTCSMYP